MPSFRLLAPALFALALCGAPAAWAQSFSDVQRGDIEAIVKNYLISHPEVLEEAMAELGKRQAALKPKKHKASIAKNGETIFTRRAASPSATRMATSPSSSSLIIIAATANAPWPTCSI